MAERFRFDTPCITAVILVTAEKSEFILTNVMMTSLVTRFLLTWVLFIPLAIANGILREKGYKPFVGELTAHQLSTVSASIAYLLLVYVLWHQHIGQLHARQLFLMGFLWVVMTILFEFGFGHYVDKVSWEKLIGDYNIFTGHVWGLFLLVIFLSPFIIKKLQDIFH